MLLGPRLVFGYFSHEDVVHGLRHHFHAVGLMRGPFIVIFCLPARDRLENFRLQQSDFTLTDGPTSNNKSPVMIAGDALHSLMTLLSYVLAGLKNHKGSATRMWFLRSTGGREHDRVGDVVQRELVDHKAEFGRQSHELERLLIVRRVCSIGAHGVWVASVTVLRNNLLERLTSLRGVAVRVLVGGLHRALVDVY